jgi:hypothetical protein
MFFLIFSNKLKQENKDFYLKSEEVKLKKEK